MKIYINSIKFNRSLVDGPGVRTVVFFQGCDLRCKGCQNPSAWDMEQGTPIDVADLAELLRKEVPNKKITFSGGEPLMQLDGLLALVDLLDDFDIAVYTGHAFAEVPDALLEKIRYLKTGPFIESQKTTVKPYVGSENQSFQEVKRNAKM